MKRKNHSIRFKLTFYTVICFCVFLLAISASAATIYYTSITDIIEDQIINTSRQVVSNYELYFDSAIEVSNSIQYKIDNRDVLNEKSAIQAYFDDVKSIKNEIISISLYDEDGDFLVGDSSINESSVTNIKDNSSFIDAMNEPMINIFSGIGYENNRYAFTLSRYLPFNKENNHGVVLIEFDFTRIVRLIYQSDLGENGHIAIFDRNYNVVYSSAPSFVEEDLNATKNLVLGSSGVTIGGQSFNLYISTITNTGWKVSVFTNNSVVYSILTNFIIVVLVITFVLSIIYVFIVYFIVKQVTYPLYRLQNEMNTVKDLNYSARRETLKKGSKEIIQLDATFNEMMKRIRYLANKIVEEEENQRKSELKALQNQINPHFLYNTLDSIIYMIDKGENGKAEEMIVALSKFFRISISRGRNIIPLKDEIEHVRNYLLIQKIRFGDQFIYKINVAPGLEKYYVIKLILQPLVENAIEHGLSENEKGGEIDISASENDKYIVFTIKDNGFGISEDKLHAIYESLQNDSIHQGVGIKNVYQRIKIYYGDEADLRIDSIEDEGTTISIFIPKKKAEKYEEK